MNQLINNHLDLTTKRDRLLNYFATLKYEYIDVENSLSVTKKENCGLKEPINQHGSAILALKFEIIKFSIRNKGKRL